MCKGRKINAVSKDSRKVEEFANLIVKEWPDNDLKEILELPLHKIFIAEDNGSITGGAIICITPKNAYCIAYLLVKEDSRNIGIGSELLEMCKKFASEEDCTRKLELLTEKGNTRRRKFFENHGFSFTREIPNYYEQDEDSTACLYTLKIEPGASSQYESSTKL